jgi:hypothetical protein
MPQRSAYLAWECSLLDHGIRFCRLIDRSGLSRFGPLPDIPNRQVLDLPRLSAGSRPKWWKVKGSNPLKAKQL